MHFEVSHGVLA